MHQIGSRVLYRSSGVCTVKELKEAELTKGEVRQYYVLVPDSDPQSKLFVPAGNEELTSQIRQLMTKEEALSFIGTLPSLPSLWENDGRQRAALYRNLLARAQREELWGMVKAIRLRRIEYNKIGKKLYSSDEAALKKAEKLLFEELAEELALTQDEILPLLRERTREACLNE